MKNQKDEKMNHNLQKAIQYVKNNPTVGFNHTGQKFHINPEYLQKKWAEYSKQKEKVKV